jgi:hypothetical protein
MTQKSRNPLDDLKFEIEKSLRYHQRRRGHYEFAHRILMFFVVLSGSATAALVPDEYRLLGLLASLFGVIDLVYSPGLQAREHLELHQKFSALLQRIVASNNPTDADIIAWGAEKVGIEVDEPPIFWALETDCYNEVARAWGKDEYIVKQGAFRRALMQWVRFDRVLA